MNDEIKEILDNPKILILSYGTYISLNDYFKLKDYITNLQQENEDYKSRVEKAVECINEYKELVGLTGALVYNLLNILQNGDDEECKLEIM